MDNFILKDFALYDAYYPHCNLIFGFACSGGNFESIKSGCQKEIEKTPISSTLKNSYRFIYYIIGNADYNLFPVSI